MGQCLNCQKHVGPRDVKVEAAMFGRASLLCCPHCDIILGTDRND